MSIPMTSQADLRKRMWVVGLLLLVVGLMVRAGLAYFSPSMYWPDEVYQTLEPAHRLAFGYGRVMWEYHDGLRSWVFPGFLAGFMWVGQFLGEGSTGYLALIAVVLSAVSLIPPIVTFLWADREWQSRWWPVVAMVFPLVWFEAIYFGPKALYESFTIHGVIAGIFFVRFADDRWMRPLIGGLLIGICVITRPHLALVPVVVGLLVPLHAKRPHAMFSALVVGIVGGAGIAGLVDLIAYGVPFHSVIVNIHANVIQGKASNFGTAPWWQYFAWSWEVSRLGALAIGAALVAGAVRYPMLALPALAILGAHCFIPHKEYRFLYPVIVLATMIVGLDAVRLGDWISEALDVSHAKVACVSMFLVLWSAASVYDGVDFRLGSIGEQNEQLNWTDRQGHLLAYRYLSTRDICGLGRVEFWHLDTGGYSHLHHDVPIPWARDAEAARSLRSKFDAFVVNGWDRESFAGFERDRCFLDTCVYLRDGDCE
jgi:hypothetical protein